MNLSFFTANLTNPAILCPAIYKQWKTYFELKAFREINPECHKINSLAERPNKIIWSPDPRNPEGAPVMSLVKRARIAVPMQKLIVSRANAFMTGGPVTFKAKPDGAKEEALLKYFNKTWKATKCDFKNSEIGKALLSETEVAEIWFSRLGEDGETPELRCNIYKPSDGYHLIPVFDNTRDLIAFGLGYKTKDEDGKEEDHLDIYTKEFIYKYYKGRTGDWTVVTSTEQAPNPVKLLYGKIPVVYYSICKSVWNDVQPMIERLETLLSNFADTNDYNGSPILFAEGQIKGMSAKGEAGKLIEGEQGAKLSYVSWNHAPESIKLEIDKLVEFIYTCTQTPNLSFEALKGIGKISGIAFDRMMIDAHLKAKDMHTGPYGEGIQRRCNFITHAASNLYKEFKGIELDITPQFELFRIDDNSERVDWIQKANGGLAVMAWKDSIAAARLTDDPEQTYLDLVEQEAANAAIEGGGGNSVKLTVGTKVKVKPGKENDPSHKGVDFIINGIGEAEPIMYSLTSTDTTLTGSLNYLGESLAVSN